MQYRIAIVEDEKGSAGTLTGYLRRYQQECGCEFECVWFQSGAEFLEAYQCDYAVVFMDIDMPLMNGMQTAKRLREKDSGVCLIFVTNLAQYALQGYEVQAMNFLVKPVAYYPFSQAVSKALSYVRYISSPEIMVTTQDGNFRVPVQSILYVEVQNHWLYFHLTNGEHKVVRETMKEMEERLARFGFFRCNNCYLVNLRHVNCLQKESVRVGKQELVVSRSRRKAFLTALTNYMGDMV